MYLIVSGESHRALLSGNRSVFMSMGREKLPNLDWWSINASLRRGHLNFHLSDETEAVLKN